MGFERAEARRALSPAEAGREAKASADESELAQDSALPRTTKSERKRGRGGNPTPGAKEKNWSCANIFPFVSGVLRKPAPRFGTEESSNPTPGAMKIIKDKTSLEELRLMVGKI